MLQGAPLSLLLCGCTGQIMADLAAGGACWAEVMEAVEQVMVDFLPPLYHNVLQKRGSL